MVYTSSDQKAERIARLLDEEFVPFFSVPEALLLDRGTNLLSHSHLMKDVCKLLGINSITHHPEYDGAVERFNCTLKTIQNSVGQVYPWSCVGLS